MGGLVMNQYLVMYRPLNDNKYYPSLHIWPEILTMLRKREETKGRMFIYLLASEVPEPMCVCHRVDVYWLEDMNGIYVEGE